MVWGGFQLLITVYLRFSIIRDTTGVESGNFFAAS
jgi:hypothetical protein